MFPNFNFMASELCDKQINSNFMVINISETQGDKKNEQKAIAHYYIDNF